MASYQIPPDTRAKEKIIGGIFTITQMVFLVVGVILGGILAIVSYNAFKSIILSVILLLIGTGPFIPFAFITKHDMGDIELAKYLLYKIKYKNSRRNWYNYNENYKGVIKEDK